ncbi:MAG: helix-turn-helix domain-containing protein [Prevotellaceae bacterium]|nr:helix-turn-helix domain-containing protein [Prevotellaceae bacterium]MCD8285487.1 helix-turn-helix domain-containing protein [Prevotellaceae bacterium]MCD8303440.1 helix-turn-helix domain-containing protein [Prevotellaceae bacterium]
MAKYNFTAERKIKNAAYRNHIHADLADQLYEKILHKMVVEKKYRDPTYNAQILAKELETNARCISAVVNLRFNMNYSCLVNEYRVREAQYLLVDKRYADKTIEKISAMVGFNNRQSFYAAFYRFLGTTPNEYRIQNTKEQTRKKRTPKKAAQAETK